MTTVVNLHRDPYDVLICRPSKWGNPFRITDKCPRELALEKYEVHIRRRPDLIAVGARTGREAAGLPLPPAPLSRGRVGMPAARIFCL